MEGLQADPSVFSVIEVLFIWYLSILQAQRSSGVLWQIFRARRATTNAFTIRSCYIGDEVCVHVVFSLCV